MSNNQITPDGYVYLTTGEFVNKFGSSTKVYAAARVKQTKDKDNPKLIKYEIEDTTDLEIAHDNFCAIAGVIYYEDRSAWEGCASIANTTLNMVRLVKGNDLSTSDENKWMKVLLLTGYSTASSKASLKETSKSNEALNVRRGLIHVLMRKSPDYSDSAVAWDGIDFAGKGVTHNKATKDGGISITRDLWEKFVGVCLFKSDRVTDKNSPYYGKEVLDYGSPKTKDEVLRNIPFLPKPPEDNISAPYIDIVVPKETNKNIPDNLYQLDWQLYESIGTGKFNKGRTLYKAAVVRGRQIYWKPNREHINNKENKEKSIKAYDWKYLGLDWFRGKTICLLILISSLLTACNGNAQIKEKNNLIINEINENSYNDTIEDSFRVLGTAGNIDYNDRRYNILTAVYAYGDTVKPEYYQLKNNYHLSLIPVIDSENKNNFSLFTRLQGDNLDTIIHVSSIHYKYQTIYKEIDFDDYFCISQSGGSSIYTTLYEKATGKQILYGAESAYDIENQFMIYEEESSEIDSRFTLYDVKNKKKYPIYTDNIDDPVVGFIGVSNFYSVDKVTKDYVNVKLSNGDIKPYYIIKVKR